MESEFIDWYDCDTQYCQFFTCYTESYLKHKQLHGLLGSHKCDTCHYIAERRSELLVHEFIEHSMHAHKCNLCNFSTIDYERLERHSMAHHMPSYKCNVCNLMSVTKEEMDIHRDTHGYFHSRLCKAKTATSCQFGTQDKYPRTKLLMHKFVWHDAKPECENCYCNFDNFVNYIHHTYVCGPASGGSMSPHKKWIS